MENNRSRVLIVDDMQINRIVLASLLATRGIMSDQAESGMECIRLCEDNAYDLILLDHRMPELDGVDTLVRLKELFDERGVDIPVICHTTGEGRNNINLYKAAGFADCLIKPIDPRELFEVIVTYLGDNYPAAGSDKSDSYEPASQTDITLGTDAQKASDRTNTSDDIDYTDNAKEEIEKLPLWLKIVPHIDLVAGVANCGDAEDYMDALYIFYSSIEEKSEEIENFLSHDDWTMYALRIHSLKSMARLVGAKKLGESAAYLEAAARDERYDTVRKKTPDFISAYREFKSLLIHFEEEKYNYSEPETEASDTDSKINAADTDKSHSILYIQNGEGIVKKGIEKNLSDAEFNVITIPDEPDRIISHRNDADIVIYNPGLNDDSNITITMSLLGEICQDDSKILCLTGDMTDINTAMTANGSHRVSRIYPRPVAIDSFVNDMLFFAGLEEEYHQKKTVYVVDDDPGYLSVINHWLSPAYNVSLFSSGMDVLTGLSAVTPDLILLDLEMPEMDGCELMKNIRTEYPEPHIPIIFLTGKNDKDIVFHVLEYKPDGYLLKTSQKDNILDVIHRFFAESMFKMTLLK